MTAWRAAGVWAWDLHVANVTLQDAGVYECQINTRPKHSHPVELNVTGKSEQRHGEVGTTSRGSRNYVTGKSEQRHG